MQITKENFIFWTILENSSHTKVPCTIKNVLSLQGFGRAMTFKTITDEDLVEIEKYVQTNLMTDLKMHLQIEDECSDDDLAMFFGVYFKNPSLFKFKLGEKRLMKELVSHVISILNDEHGGIEFFAPKLNARSEQRYASLISTSTCTSALGQYFTDRDSVIAGGNKIVDSRSLDDLKQCLLEAAERTLNKLGAKHKMRSVREFGDDSVIVTKTKDSVINGEVLCTFCQSTSPVSRVKVYFSHRGKGSWVSSNIDKHFRNHHEKKDKHPKTEKNIRTVELKVEPTEPNNNKEEDPFITNCSDTLITQLTLQKVKVNNAIHLNKENVYKLRFQPGDIKYVIDICRMDPNGDCLFAALAHQLELYKANSKLHKEKANDLRTMVVKHINDNFDDFKSYLKARVLEQNGIINDLDKECHEFLDENLSQTGIWGGSETLKAVSELFDVNIVILIEDGVCNIGTRFNDKYTRSLLISFRELCDTSGKRIGPNHYDSVIDLSNCTLRHCARTIAESEYKYLCLKDMNGAVINIDDSFN